MYGLLQLGILFEYSGEVTAQDAEGILAKIAGLHRRALLATEIAKGQERIDSLCMFATDLEKTFYGFEPDFFQHNLVRIGEDAVGVIKSTLELWPTLVEICSFQKETDPFSTAPMWLKPSQGTPMSSPLTSHVSLALDFPLSVSISA